MAWMGRWRMLVALGALGGAVLLAGCPGKLEDPERFLRDAGGAGGAGSTTTSTTTTDTGTGGAPGAGGAGGA